MNVNRRQFVGTLSAGAAAAALGMTGCTPASVLAGLEKWMPVGLNAFTGVVAIINPAAGTALATSVIVAKALWADVSAAIAAYDAAPASSKASVLGKVETALGSLITGLPDILKNIGQAPYAGTVTAAIDLIISTLAAIDINIGGTPPASAQRVMLGTKSAISPSDFKKNFNSILQNGGYGQFAI